ncbi:MAG: 1-acyl-sn-glycerol-3-phosphate acyltransferase [Alphaproteobacteria bacterium]|nr:1-acyl-sn-glycerol-3-phosphate acyltransferase [Rhizobiaceae bacterium]MBU3963563.1 1-acyl-sn-glycerol-3-phosphate acyltransferase [Alphaproteobacteria bacterium]MBU4052027.1 1-acyl-sn-glycerol-3-phosphate acyltransferase [Alphaproteobacteria bacterium]MBU4088028.1 1-acyl-sn-glycerol-3-phosphate acyltransferase [Alphaproteobacteria bacterium]MBU4157567.1 1-acyl-sn-glycerol-3-phosphate acyltransferase [Alphaproteobacteria bacterium]
MIILRSILFNTLFYANLVLQMVLLSPYYFLASRKKAFAIPKNWARSNHWLMEKVVGTTFTVEGLENIPEGGYILAPKHQSLWDTYALLPWLDDPVYILKRELMWIPIFGWYVARQKMIPVDRGARGKVMVKVMERAKQEMAAGRQLIIYPEGTRRPAGAEPAYKYGIARIYRDLDVPVVPVAMHPGLFWPRRKFLRFPGHFKVKILPPIEPGLDPDVFYETLVEKLEKASDELLIETVRDNPQVPLPPTAVQRLKELQAQGTA